MAKSTTNRKRRNSTAPKKPHPDFPLTPRRDDAPVPLDSPVQFGQVQECALDVRTERLAIGTPRLERHRAGNQEHVHRRVLGRVQRQQLADFRRSALRAELPDLLALERPRLAPPGGDDRPDAGGIRLGRTKSGATHEENSRSAPARILRLWLSSRRAYANTIERPS